MPPPQPEIRPATARDTDALARLFDDYRRFFTHADDLETSRRFLRERLERGESVVLAAFADKTPAGFAQLYPLFSSWYARRQWFLSDLYVGPQFRTRGIGKRLVAACGEFARRDGARAILVELPYSEPHLSAFYGALGFEKDAVFELYRLILN